MFLLKNPARDLPDRKADSTLGEICQSPIAKILCPIFVYI
jgi:hypothetical protein